MNPAFLVRFRPAGPWRVGPDSGARDRVDRIYHSDSLFSAVTHAMSRLGRLEEWLAATAGNEAGSAVRFSSCFPFFEDTQLVVPPRHFWPPPPSPKVRWQQARFVPIAVVAALVSEQPLDDGAWSLDGPSECLLPTGAHFRGGPFRQALRTHACVDRPSASGVVLHQTACLEFAEGAGLWAAVEFAGEEAASQWAGPVRAALRLLADTGVGGERSIGWGRSEEPEFIEGTLPELILPAVPEAPRAEESAEEGEAAPKPACETGYWLLSMFSPAPRDAVDWQRGSYSLVSRGGRVDSPAGAGQSKKLARMVEEGSVLAAEAPPAGAAPDVAPEGFPHPIFRAGFALAIPVPLRQIERPLGAS
jgi:CRISPR/Cas system CSM-associated protein Csm4 (group 5 of RAMP superfamily)